MFARTLVVCAAVTTGALLFDLGAVTFTGAAAQTDDRDRWNRSRNTQTQTRSYSSERSDDRRTPSVNSNTRSDPNYKTRQQIENMHWENGSLYGD